MFLKYSITDSYEQIFLLATLSRSSLPVVFGCFFFLVFFLFFFFVFFLGGGGGGGGLFFL